MNYLLIVQSTNYVSLRGLKDFLKNVLIWFLKELVLHRSVYILIIGFELLSASQQCEVNWEHEEIIISVVITIYSY
jgi:hypothetical protein